jgi:hypothetical protein
MIESRTPRSQSRECAVGGDCRSNDYGFGAARKETEFFLMIRMLGGHRLGEETRSLDWR